MTARTRPTLVSTPLSAAITVATLALIALIAATNPAGAQQWPPEIKNLQVIPSETPLRELIGMMRGFTTALGVRCQHCHVGEEGQPLAEFDFAVDAKPAKERARTMIAMTKAINGEHLAKLDIKGGALNVQCVTCHRGTTRPEQLGDLLARIASDESSEAAVAKYKALRNEHYGSSTFDFGERSLVDAAQILIATDNNRAAVALLELNLEHYPESQGTSFTLAGAYEQTDRKDEALAIWKKLLEENPGNPRIQQQVKRLEASDR